MANGWTVCYHGVPHCCCLLWQGNESCTYCAMIVVLLITLPSFEEQHLTSYFTSTWHMMHRSEMYYTKTTILEQPLCVLGP